MKNTVFYVIYTNTTRKLSDWRNNEILQLLSVRASAEFVRQIQGTARESVVCDQITNQKCEETADFMHHVQPPAGSSQAQLNHAEYFQ